VDLDFGDGSRIPAEAAEVSGFAPEKSFRARRQAKAIVYGPGPHRLYVEIARRGIGYRFRFGCHGSRGIGVGQAHGHKGCVFPHLIVQRVLDPD
jgi:hypothetical protein